MEIEGMDYHKRYIQLVAFNLLTIKLALTYLTISKKKRKSVMFKISIKLLLDISSYGNITKATFGYGFY